MVTGHLNPGYKKIVTKLSIDPEPYLNPKPIDRYLLENIRSKSTFIWSNQDNSETTYGYFFSPPAIKSRPKMRPVSPSRRNNPHPKEVFMTSHLSRVPRCFGDESKVEWSYEKEIREKSPRTDYVQIPANINLFDQDSKLNREKYLTGNHGFPNPNAKRYVRGDFCIHPDWSPKLKHHRV